MLRCSAPKIKRLLDGLARRRTIRGVSRLISVSFSRSDSAFATRVAVTDRSVDWIVSLAMVYVPRVSRRPSPTLEISTSFAGALHFASKTTVLRELAR